jgi:hypothetical protein
MSKPNYLSVRDVHIDYAGVDLSPLGQPAPFVEFELKDGAKPEAERHRILKALKVEYEGSEYMSKVIGNRLFVWRVK